VPVSIPIGIEKDLVGVIDLVDMRALVYDDESLGAKVEVQDIPDGMLEQARVARSELVEKVAERADEIMELYVDEKPVPADVLRAAIRRQTVAGTLVPVLCGAALRNKGIQSVLDAVVDYLPSPVDVPPVLAPVAERIRKKGRRKPVPATEEKTAEILPDASEPVSAMIFKTVSDLHGELAYVRVYSGTLNEGEQVFIPSQDKVERIGRLLRIHANHRDRVERLGPGEIGAVLGLKSGRTGDTLCSPTRPVLLEVPVFPDTVLSMAVEPRSAADKDRVVEVLDIISRDDPTFRCRVDDETGQMIISGMGELHLEVVKNKMLREFKVAVNVGKPRVSYRQTVAGSAKGEGKFDRQLGGRGQYGHVLLEVEPVAGALEVEVVSRLTKEDVPKVFHELIEDSIYEMADAGHTMGYSLIGFRVTLVGGSSHPTDSTEAAYRAAAKLAFDDAIEKAGLVLLEPIMKIEVAVPEGYMRGVLADLNGRRVRITEMDLNSDPRLVLGEVPLSEMFGYTTVVRSLSQGRATFSMEPSSYAPVPKSVADKIMI
jgi:elongation factor G